MTVKLVSKVTFLDIRST